MKKLFALLVLCLVFSVTQAQNGLEGIIVEKYYISNAADNSADPTLPIGSTTYRVYVDMLPGYKFQMAYGSPTHQLNIATTTVFYNEGNYGSVNPSLSVGNAKKKTAMLDSYLSVGGACAGFMGVLKTEDDGQNNFVISNGCLLNNDTRMGIPLNVQDGMYAATVPSFATIGLTNETDIFNDGTTNGNLFTTANGAWTCLAGAIGPLTSNRVLIGQFTTNGVFSFELNIQIGTPSGGIEKYVANNAIGEEITLPSLTQTYGPPVPPVVSITSPANNANIITGDIVSITADASDSDGNIVSVEFFVNGTSVGIDNTAPYSVNWTSTAGNKALTAKVTDNEGDQTTSTPVNIVVADNQAPVVSITAPANSSSHVVDDIITITANASDIDGTVTAVEFFVDGNSIGVDNTAPYSMNYTAAFGPHTLRASATDDRALTANSGNVTIQVMNNVPPTASITSPVAGSVFTAPQVVTINANATDTDGSVEKVEFFVNNVKVGEDIAAPYSYDWTSEVGNANLRVKSYDNKGVATWSAIVTVSVADPNALPYAVISESNTCLPQIFTLDIDAIDQVNYVIGYDFTVDYEALKIQPTGVIVKSNELLQESYYDISSYIDMANAKINISMTLNGNAPNNTFFNGVGTLCSIEFQKTANFQPVDNATVGVSSLRESYYTGIQQKLVTAGKYSTSKDSSFVAAIKFWKDKSPMSYNSANPNEFAITKIFGTATDCTNKTTESVSPDLNGFFTHNINTGLAVTFERDINDNVSVQSVVNNGGDVVIAKKMVVVDPVYTPSLYEVLAADVNLDGVVSSGDISQIQQRSVLSIPEFKQVWNYNQQGVSNGEKSYDWLFIDSTRIASNPAFANFSINAVPAVPTCLPIPVSNFSTCPEISAETYIAVLIGDINGNYKDIAADGLLKSTESGMIVLDFVNAIDNQNYIDIPVYVSSENSVLGIDFATKFNQNLLAYDTVLDQLQYLDEVAHYNNNDQTLRCGATTDNNEIIPSNEKMLYIRFTKLFPGTVISASDIYPIEAYINGDLVSLEVNTSTSIKVSESANILLYPNPTSDVLNVTVSENALIEMYDLNGKSVINPVSVNANKPSVLSLDNLSEGMYNVKISNNGFVTFRKIILSR